VPDHLIPRWDASHYLRYGNERTRAAEDLVDRIQLIPSRIVDLGCGPGNSTSILHQRWPQAKLTGVDRSAEMIEAARLSQPDWQWIEADAASWQPTEPVDLVFSNAALQRLPEHVALLPHLLSMVADEGALAFQVPSRTFAAVRTLIHEVSFGNRWKERMSAAREALTLHSPAFYYDQLVPSATHLDIWETEYQHVMESRESIIDWMSSTGLRAFFAAMNSDGERTLFLNDPRARLEEAYERRADGRVLFPFRRTFVIAYR